MKLTVKNLGDAFVTDLVIWCHERGADIDYDSEHELVSMPGKPMKISKTPKPPMAFPDKPTDYEIIYRYLLQQTEPVAKRLIKEHLKNMGGSDQSVSKVLTIAGPDTYNKKLKKWTIRKKLVAKELRGKYVFYYLTTKGKKWKNWENFHAEEE